MLNIPYYLFSNIEKMAYIVQKRDYNHRMKSLFHHSLIKIIFLPHLDKLNISWDTFIANEIFTAPPIQHAQAVPPPSHLSTDIPPSQPTTPTSS